MIYTNLNYYSHLLLNSKYELLIKSLFIIVVYFICLQLHYFDNSTIVCAPLTSENTKWLEASQSQHQQDIVRHLTNKEIREFYTFYNENPENALIQGLKIIMETDPDIYNNIQTRKRGLIMWALRDYFYKHTVITPLEITIDETKSDDSLLSNAGNDVTETNCYRCDKYCTLTYNCVYSMIGLVVISVIISGVIGYQINLAECSS